VVFTAAGLIADDHAVVEAGPGAAAFVPLEYARDRRWDGRAAASIGRPRA